MQKILTLLFMLTTAITTFGQTPGWDWAKKAGATYGGVIPYDMAIDSEGNVYVVGYFWKDAYFDDIHLVSYSGTNDVFIAKYNAAGDVLWAIRAGGNNVDGADGISIDKEGSIYITGFFRSPTIVFGST